MEAKAQSLQSIAAEQEWESSPERSLLYKQASLEVELEEWELSPERSDLFRQAVLEAGQDEWEADSERSDLFKEAALEIGQEEWEASSARSDLFKAVSLRHNLRESRREKSHVRAQYVTLLLTVSQLAREALLSDDERAELKTAIVNSSWPGHNALFASVRWYREYGDRARFVRTIQQLASHSLLRQSLHVPETSMQEPKTPLQEPMSPFVGPKSPSQLGPQDSPLGVGDFSWTRSPSLLSKRQALTPMPALALS